MPTISTLSFSSPGAHRDLHSFPTRRSSDLQVPELDRLVRAGAGELRAVGMILRERRPLWMGSERGDDADVEEARCLVRRRSEEHTSELQSRRDLVCRLLLEKKNKNKIDTLL